MKKAALVLWLSLAAVGAFAQGTLDLGNGAHLALRTNSIGLSPSAADFQGHFQSPVMPPGCDSGGPIMALVPLNVVRLSDGGVSIDSFQIPEPTPLGLL